MTKIKIISVQVLTKIYEKIITIAPKVGVARFVAGISRVVSEQNDKVRPPGLPPTPADCQGSLLGREERGKGDKEEGGRESGKRGAKREGGREVSLFTAGHTGGDRSQRSGSRASLSPLLTKLTAHTTDSLNHQLGGRCQHCGVCPECL